MSVISEQTRDDIYEKDQKKLFYTFFRDGRELPEGRMKASSATGLIKTGFRPSDDAN